MKTLKTVLFDCYHKYSLIPKRDIQEIVAFVLKMRREHLFVSFDIDVDSSLIEEIGNVLRERSSGKPLAYLLGYVDFYGCKITVNPSVLIPRLETEILLDKVLHLTQGRLINAVFDICSGSGCLGIAFKKERQLSDVYLSDLSAKALLTAKKNAQLNEVKVNCLEGDLLEPFKEVPKADLVFCNPPYVSDKEYLSLESSVKDFEPRIALTSGPSGLEFFERLAKELPMYLNSKALVALEIGFTQKKNVIEIFSIHPWKNVRAEQDYSGLDRFIFLEIE